MSKSTEREIKLEVVLPEKGFPKTLYFNRVRVDREDGFCFVQFGLIVASDLVDSYSCVFTDEALQQNKEPLIQYLGKLGALDADTINWKGAVPVGKNDIGVVDVVTMSFRGNMSEIILSVFSICAATKASQTSHQLQADPLVLLRSVPALQKQFITALYE